MNRKICNFHRDHEHDAWEPDLNAPSIEDIVSLLKEAQREAKDEADSLLESVTIPGTMDILDRDDREETIRRYRLAQRLQNMIEHIDPLGEMTRIAQETGQYDGRRYQSAEPEDSDSPAIFTVYESYPGGVRIKWNSRTGAVKASGGEWLEPER